MPNKDEKQYGSVVNPTGNNQSAYSQPTPTGQNNPDFLDKDANEYYSMLQNQSYKALLDKQVLAAAAKDNALKYTNNMMQRSGYGSQGVSESTGLGISNSYRNALAGYQNEYNTAMNDTAQYAQTFAMENRDKNYSSLYDALTATDDAGNSTYDYAGMQEILNRYGITRNADGSYNFDRANLSDAQKREIANIIAPLTKQYDTDEENARINEENARIQNERTEELRQYAKQLGYSDEELENTTFGGFDKDKLYDDENYEKATKIMATNKKIRDEYSNVLNQAKESRERYNQAMKDAGFTDKEIEAIKTKYPDEAEKYQVNDPEKLKEYAQMRKAYNVEINKKIEEYKEKYPNVSEEDIRKIVSKQQDKDITGKTLFDKYYNQTKGTSFLGLNWFTVALGDAEEKIAKKQEKKTKN